MVVIISKMTEVVHVTKSSECLAEGSLRKVCRMHSRRKPQTTCPHPEMGMLFKHVSFM